MIKYKAVFPRYRRLNYISMSLAQRESMPDDTNWVANIYHGLDPNDYKPSYESGEYLAYLGRIIEPKGVHLAIAAVESYNRTHPDHKIRLRIAGKHYAGSGKDSYWSDVVEPRLGGDIEYVGFLHGHAKIDFLRQARAAIVPSIFDEPFGLVSIEALACGTPVIGLNHGATPEIIAHGRDGFIATPDTLADYFDQIPEIDRRICRQTFEKRFTLDRMARQHAKLYQKLAGG
jgi:glycosyltransferase involved in cell wall biosynthesis